METLTIEDILVDPTPVEIKTGGKSLKVWVRALTATEQDLCRGGGRRASRDLRRLLEDPKTEEHQLLIKDEIEEYTKDSLADLWINNHLMERALQVNNRSLEDRDKHYIEEPGEDANSADIDHYENEVEDSEEKREESVLKAVVNIKDELEKEAQKLSINKLRSDAIPTLIDNVCQETFSREFGMQMIARGTFNDKDCLKPTFKATSQVKRLRADTLQTLSEAHYGLMVDAEAVKN